MAGFASFYNKGGPIARTHYIFSSSNPEFHHMMATPIPLGRSCHQCEKPEDAETKLLHCGKCQTTLYCSGKCQKIDWPNHRQLTCKINSLIGKTASISWLISCLITSAKCTKLKEFTESTALTISKSDIIKDILEIAYTDYIKKVNLGFFATKVCQQLDIPLCHYSCN